MDEQKQAAAGIASALIHYWDVAFAFVLAMFFGLIRYLQDILDPSTPSRFKWIIALAKALVAGSVGLLTYWLLAEWQVSKHLSAFLIGVAGYGGAETLQAFKEAAFSALRSYIGKTPGTKDSSSKD